LELFAGILGLPFERRDPASTRTVWSKGRRDESAALLDSCLIGALAEDEQFEFVHVTEGSACGTRSTACGVDDVERVKGPGSAFVISRVDERVIASAAFRW
jgi:hypothetical protein